MESSSSPAIRAIDVPEYTKGRLSHDCPSFLELPTDIHVQLASYLGYRDLQMLRATNTYFRSIYSDFQIAQSREEYIRTLLDQEVKEALMDRQRDFNLEVYGFSRDFGYHDPRLTCYSCLRRLPEQDFADTQVTRRRRKGHADAYKRFCTECAIRGNKWEPGITLSFQGREMVYCRRCRSIRRIPVHDPMKMVGLCQECCDATGISDFHRSDILDWYAGKILIERFFTRYSNSRVVIPEEDWLKLESELSELGSLRRSFVS
ncbi:hypothetical protein DIZ76_016091 [Coccidioides immitis]|nr:hypothetical protein DIZ76_016091 [Coccidioides immitis]